MFLAVRDGHEIVAIANLKPTEEDLKLGDELDSYMYQTVGYQAIDLIAEALDKPLYRADITGTSQNKDLDYAVPSPRTDRSHHQQEDEVEQLYKLLKDMREKYEVEFDAVCVGAIASSYQKSRVESICQRMNLVMLAYLWSREQDQLLQDMIDNNFDAILIKVACMGLNKEHIGLSIKEAQPHLRKLNAEYKTNICGEGGEFESLVLDCPLYKKRLSLDSFDVVCHSSDVFAPVYYIKPIKMSLVDK